MKLYQRDSKHLVSTFCLLTLSQTRGVDLESTLLARVRLTQIGQVLRKIPIQHSLL